MRKRIVKKFQLVTRANKIAKAKKRNSLNFLFDEQIKRLTSLKYPKEIVNLLKEQKSSVLAKAESLGFNGIKTKENEILIPFMPVIPENNLSFLEQLQKIKRGMRAPSLVNINKLDVARSKKGKPHFIFDFHVKIKNLEDSPKHELLSREIILSLITHYFDKLPALAKIPTICGNYFVVKSEGYNVIYNSKIANEKIQKQIVLSHCA